MSKPVAWIPISTRWPFEDLDILFSDGSVLMSVIPQADGDFWWRGGGAGERFFDPVYSEVTHWRPHVDSSTADAIREAVTAEREACAKLKDVAEEVFDAHGPETPQVVRDVIEWFASSIRARGAA